MFLFLIFTQKFQIITLDTYTHGLDIIICELQAEKLPYLKSLTLTGNTNVFDSDHLDYLHRTMFDGPHYRELKKIGKMMAVWNLEYLNLSFNRSISGQLSVLLRHRFPVTRNSGAS